MDITWVAADGLKVSIDDAEEVVNSIKDRQRARNEDPDFRLFMDSEIGLNFGISLDAPKFVRNFDVLTIALDKRFVFSPDPIFKYAKLIDFFSGLIKIFQPFWGAIVDKDQISSEYYQELRRSVNSEKIPASMHWINYVNESIANRLGGIQLLEEAPIQDFITLNSPKGIIVVLQKEPFDLNNSEHLEHLEKLHKYLGMKNLRQIHKRHS
jgi:hypothetical protein